MRAPMPDNDSFTAPRPDDALPPTVARAAAALRATVPVRAEWRERVLAEIDSAAREEHPALASIGARRVRTGRGARLVIAWPVAAAAGVILFAAGVLAARMTEAPAPASREGVARSRPADVVRGTTRFVLVAPNARQVALVGDFNLWNPASAPMQRIPGTDEWEVDLPLPAGRHAYAFVVDGDVTADPSAPRTGGDDFGRPNSVVLVSSPRS